MSLLIGLYHLAIVAVIGLAVLYLFTLMIVGGGALITAAIGAILSWIGNKIKGGKE